MNSESQSLVPATQRAESEELTVDEVRESLSTTEKGQPANTIGNCRTVFCQDPLLRGAIRLNLLTDRVDIVRNLGWRRSTSALTDTDVKYLLLYFEQNYGLTSEKKLMAALSMPEDTEAGQIQGFLEHYTGNVVCSKQLFKEALGHAFEEPKRWQLHNINEIMNTVVTGWKPFSNPRMFAGYGRQRGWEREISGNELPGNEGGFVELSEEEVRQLELPKEWIA